jgi:hypothetical protein
MENSSSNTEKDNHDSTHPKPTEDAGAQIETVTPDTEKEGASNDRKVTSPDIKGPSKTDQEEEPGDAQHKDKPDNEGNEEVDSENPEPDQDQQDQNEGDGPEIETVAP